MVLRLYKGTTSTIKQVQIIFCMSLLNCISSGTKKVHSITFNMQRCRNTQRSFTYVKRGVARPCKIIYVGNPKGLDGHRAHAKEQLSAGHEKPQVLGVGQTPAVVLATGLRVVRVPLRVANVMTI